MGRLSENHETTKVGAKAVSKHLAGISDGRACRLKSGAIIRALIAASIAKMHLACKIGLIGNSGENHMPCQLSDRPLDKTSDL